MVFAMQLPNDYISYGRVHTAGRIVRFCMCRDCRTLRLERENERNLTIEELFVEFKYTLPHKEEQTPGHIVYQYT